MRTDTRPRAISAGALYGGTASLVQAAFADDPFYTITASAIAITAVLLGVYLLEGFFYRRRTEKERSCRPN